MPANEPQNEACPNLLSKHIVQTMVIAADAITLLWPTNCAYQVPTVAVTFIKVRAAVRNELELRYFCINSYKFVLLNNSSRKLVFVLVTECCSNNVFPLLSKYNSSRFFSPLSLEDNELESKESVFLSFR